MALRPLTTPAPSQMLGSPHVAFAGTDDYPWVESMWGRIKTELGSLITEAETLDEVRSIMDGHMEYCNTQRRYSSIGYQAPLAHMEQHFFGEDAAPT